MRIFTALSNGRFAFTAKPVKERFHALDSVRAVAMLLGVVLHIVTTGLALNLPTPASATQAMQWIHSFRMPLFFLISGFFCRMMFSRYGYPVYLKRRTGKLLAALAIALLGPIVFNGIKFIFNLFRNFSPQAIPGMDSLENFEAYFLGLGALWFLWYLIVFASIAPLVAGMLERFRTKRILKGSFDRFESWIVKYSLAPAIMAVVCFPVRIHIVQDGSWALGFASGINSSLPDAFWQFQPDWPLYFFYFFSGWWLERVKTSLFSLSQRWSTIIVLGSAFYVASVSFENRFYAESVAKNQGGMAFVGCALYDFATAYTVFGMIAIFQKFMNRSSQIIRYFSDRAFWIYIIHVKILPKTLTVLSGWHLSYALQSTLTFLVTTLLSCALYDLVVRPTFLSSIFGSTKTGSGANSAALNSNLSNASPEPVTSVN